MDLEDETGFKGIDVSEAWRKGLTQGSPADPKPKWERGESGQLIDESGHVSQAKLNCKIIHRINTVSSYMPYKSEFPWRDNSQVAKRTNIKPDQM